MKTEAGKIIIAGAGPGDIELITLKLKSALNCADVVLYDYLVNRGILSFCKHSAEKISVGKSGTPDSSHKYPQEDIHRLMIKYAEEGKTVLRLKGGDPFVFGRGSEECEVLKENNIAFEIIPGISSSIAGPLYAGIPITHRGLSRSVAIATGHLVKGEDPDKIVIPKADTIVYLMAIKNLDIIVNKFLEQDYPESTKCALIERACSSKQRTFLGTLSEVCKIRDDNNVTPPALFVVGDVTDLRNSLAWIEKKPLFGKTILVTRAQSQALTMSQALRKLGADVIEYPVIDIVKIDAAKDKLCRKGFIDRFTDIIFTSVNGVEIFFEYILSSGLDARNLSGKRIIPIGKMTSNKLLQFGIKADTVPDIYQAEGILEKLDADLSGRKFLLPRAKNARKLLLEEIKKRKGEAEEVILYEAAAPDPIFDIQEEKIDAICFTSTSTVVNFCKNNSGHKDTKIFAIGKITAKSASENGFNDIETSEDATIDSMVEKIDGVFKK